ncbi:MAG: glycoside hydrolase family 3 C-terminal domain-containing protein [Acidothermales bacterium]|nr:glycoside hydrolase family 3 C-terminal domain-containing protein [Acidothermales bacterium]
MATDVDRQVGDALARLSLEQKIGQLFVTHVYGADAEHPSPEEAAHNWRVYGCETGADVVRRYYLGGVVYVGWAGNLATPAQVAALSNGLQRAAVGAGGVPLAVATAQEHGAVAQLAAPFTELPAGLALGASGSGTNAEHAATLSGRELRAVGVNQVYGPDVDVAVDPRGVVAGVQSYGSDPGLVARIGAGQVRGFHAAGVVATARHFPGRGGHAAADCTRAEWEGVDAVPFRAVVEAGVDAVMSGHVVVRALDGNGAPATLSPPILTRLLRDEVGFDGVVITDSLALQGVRATYADEQVPVLALLAGADQLLMPPDLDVAYRSVLDAVRAGGLTEERIDRSVERILRMKYARGIAERVHVDEAGVDTVVGTQQHRDAALHISDRTVTVVRDDGDVPMNPAWQAVLVVGCGTDAAEILSEALAEHCGWTCAVDAGASPGPEETKVAVARAKHHDVVVVLTGHAVDGAAPARRRLVSALLATRTPVLVVASDPYDVAHHPDAPTCLVTYSDSRTSMRSLVRVLVGEVEPRGTLPVAVPIGTGDDAGADGRASVA